jgi:hypothetical protein
MTYTNEKKFNDLVHYTCWIGSRYPNFGKTILNKVLWFADREKYIKTGKMVTNHIYIKKPYGPVPANIDSSLKELVGENKIVVNNEDYYCGYRKTNFRVLKEPSLDLLDTSDIHLLNRNIEEICQNHSANSISTLSHDFIWECATDGEEIPMYAILASEIGSITEEDKIWAHAIIKIRRSNHVNMGKM